VANAYEILLGNVHPQDVDGRFAAMELFSG